MTQDGRRDEPGHASAWATNGAHQSITDATGFAPPLGDMSADEFRRHGHAIVDWIAAYFERVEQFPVLAQVEPGTLISKLPAAPPEAGEPMEELVADIDRLIVPAIADLCERERLWLHVDAAYAGSAAVVPELRHILDGSERADSLVLNPHKWLMTPFDLSVLYTPRMDLLHRAFSLVPEYLRTLDQGQEAVRNHSEYGIQLGRRFRALKFWMVLRYFGRDGLAARIREHCCLARLFASWVEAAPGWELLAPVPLSLVCFRACLPRHGESDDEYAARLDHLNEQIMHAVNASGEAFLSHTKLHDRFTLRLAVGNIRTTEAHIARVWQLLRDACERLAAEGLKGASRQRSWLRDEEGMMPRYFFHLRLGSRIVARDGVGHECPNDAAARELARLGIRLFVLDPFLPSLFEQYCFEVVTEDGEIISPSGAG